MGHNWRKGKTIPDQATPEQRGATEEWVVSKNKRMANLRNVMTINAPIKKHRPEESWQINFSTNNVDILKDNGNHLIVISSIIDNFLVERILVDDGNVQRS